MKIVFLSPRFYPDIGGVEKHAFEVAKILAKKNEVTVITEGKKEKKEKIKNIKIIRLNFGKKDWFRKFIIWGKLLKYKKLIEKADIVHCHDVFFWYIPLRIIYPKKKVFTTFHGYETVFPPKASSIFIRKLSEKLSNGNIAIGQYIKKWYGTKSNVVLYGATGQIHTKLFKHKLGKRLNILFVGRIEKDTGVKIYGQALNSLKNYIFETCGDGNLRNELKKYGKAHGFVRNLDKYLLKADIVFSSSYLSMIAAMKFGKPVFAVYDNPLKEDYLKATPFSKWIYIVNSPKALVREVRDVIKNKKLREKNINLAYNWVKDQTWDKIARQYIELWKR